MIYLGLYCLATQNVPSLFNADEGAVIPDPATLWPLRPVISWTGAHILHVNAPVTAFWGGNSATADDMFGWVTAFCVLMIATAATVVWSLLDRSRENYAELHKWFRLFIRFALAGQMLMYGFAKVFPIQMAHPKLTWLMQPLGTFSPMGTLWNSMGSAPAYEIFTGCAEVAGGLLLIVPRTATLGALISLACMIQVFVLDMTYDVPAKLLSLPQHPALLLSPGPRRSKASQIPVAAPDHVAFHASATLPQRPGQPDRTCCANHIWSVARRHGLPLLLEFLEYPGRGKPLPPLYGIWEVKQLSIDEQLRPPLLTDSTRWRRAIFDLPSRDCAALYTQVIYTQASLCLAFQRMDDSFTPYGASVKLPERTIVLTKSADKNWTANFTFQRPAENQLILDGRMDNHQVHMELQLIDRNSFPLISRGFQWTMEAPFGRN